jgi:hypothetical protein
MSLASLLPGLARLVRDAHAQSAHADAAAAELLARFRGPRADCVAAASAELRQAGDSEGASLVALAAQRRCEGASPDASPQRCQSATSAPRKG